MRIARNTLVSISVLIVFFVFVAAIMYFGVNVSSAFAKEKYYIRLATSAAGSTGYASGMGLAACVNNWAKGVHMESVPTPGSTASAKLFGKKEVDTAYLSGWGLAEIYLNMGPFAKKPPERKPYQGFYYAPGHHFIMTKADRDDINSWHDLAGKKVFPTLAAWGWYDGWRYIFTKMGFWDKIKDRQIGLMEAADALQMGNVEAAAGYSLCGGTSTASWIRNIDARVDIKVIVPPQEERKQMMDLRMPGVYYIEDSSNVWLSPRNRKYTPSKFWCWGSAQGWHPGSDTPTEVWYQIFKAWMEHAKSDLADVNAYLKFLAEDPLGIQVMAIDGAQDIPVHPGTARYLKEKGLWKDYWKIGKLDPGVE